MVNRAMRVTSSVHAPLSFKMEATSGSSNSVDLVFVNKNGGTVLLRAGHQYYARKKHKSGLIVWACTKRKVCKGLVRIKVRKLYYQNVFHSFVVYNIIDLYVKCKKNKM